MNNISDTVELPNDFFVNEINGVLNQNKIKDYKLEIKAASGKGENYFGIIYRINVNGVDENGEKIKLSFILKIPPQSSAVREKLPVAKIYKRETFVYNVLLPEYQKIQDDFGVPKSEQFIPVKCYKTNNKEPNEFLLLEDLCANGFNLAQRKLPLEYEYVKIIMKNLARLHAASFALKKKDPKKYTEYIAQLGDCNDFGDDTFQYILKMAGQRAIEAVQDKVIKEKLETNIDDLLMKYEDYITPNEAIDPYCLICHGDTWNNNFMFKVQEGEVVDCRLFDWQMSKYCSAIVEIAYFIFNSTSYDLRKEHLQYFLDLYYETLSKNLSYMDCSIEQCWPRDKFEENLKTILIIGLGMSVMLLPAILGEAEDAPDLEDFTSKEKMESIKFEFENKHSTNLFSDRIEGVVRTFVDLEMI